MYTFYENLRLVKRFCSTRMSTVSVIDVPNAKFSAKSYNVAPAIHIKPPTINQEKGSAKLTALPKMTTWQKVVIFSAEMFGTAILLFLGCAGLVQNFYGGHASHLQICINFALAVMIPVNTFAAVGAGHLNPSVTVAALIVGKCALEAVPVYMGGQLVGAILGFGLLKVITPDVFLDTGINPLTNQTNPGVCTTIINPKINIMQGLSIEFILTLLLAWICCAVWDKRNDKYHDSVALRLGLAVGGLAMAGGPYTGASMNPVRSLAPALLNGDWENLWVYFVGPLAGGAAAAISYKLLYKPIETEEESGPETVALSVK